MITLTFDGFSGTPRELSEQVRKGKIAAKDLPVLALTDQALAQVQALGLSERSELLPLLAELLLFKLRAFAKRPQVVLAEDEEPQEESAPAFLETLLALEEAIAFLEQRSRERARVLAVPPSPLPKDRRLRPMPLQMLVRAVEPFARRAELQLERETFGLREAWERIKGFLWGVRRALFAGLPFRTWGEQTVAFASLLEAKKQGEVELLQEQNFGALEVELKSNK
ncbi:chromosome segregation protein ScpA [Meiothermus hypogaeus]|uniref:Chromosome segregation protein ScpA n=2 Tax=Meiothermus hypogaeus TaxID=884155 RepID=A0A511R385_9DEIN|nr:chromosome segregation protein ScpA [Meiothermus hypogaeus]RIH78159.1 Segregation and condensation protein A [Meiothermus hypogaeus]GEM84073.1 chromosome segregation protein ScpA [Meiothermus hypogaeus NBRC 106114]